MARLRVLGENPPPPRGNGENQLRELRDYITRLKDELEFLLTHLGEDNFSESLATWVTDTGKSVESINGEIGDINTALQGKDDADRFIVMNTDYITISTAMWQTLGGVYAIEMPITNRPTGYRPVAATIARFDGWPSGAHFVPSVGWSSGNVYILSDTAQANVGSCKLMVRVILEKEA